MKKIILLALPLLLAACFTRPAPTEDVQPQTPVVTEPQSPTTQPSVKPAPGKTTMPPKGTTETKPNPMTDETAEEFDKIIDELIGG